MNVRRSSPSIPWGVIRLVVIVVGGLVVLQSSPGLGVPKVAYLVVAGVAAAAALRNVWGLRGTAIFDAMRPWLIVSGLLMLLIAISLPVALAHGTPVAQWLRDASTYGLFAAAPVFALDAAGTGRRKLVLALTVAFASLGALSFGLYWVSLRNLAALPFSQLVLPTASLPTVLFLVSLSAAILDPRRRLAWILIGGVTLALFLVTGTRSALLILAAVPVIVVMAGRPRWRASAVGSVGIAAVAAILVLTIQAGFVSASRQLPPPIDVAAPTDGASVAPAGTGPSTPPQTGASPGATAEATPSPPLVTAPPPTNPNANLLQRILDFLASPARDGSIRERVTQYGVAWDLFTSSPILGVGLGHPFPWTRLDGSSRVDFTADTPLVLPAKLGIVGVAWLAVLAVVWVMFARRLRTGIPRLVMAGWAVVILALAWTGIAVEDKGFSFALMLILALGLMDLERAPAP
ncbi:MAG: hypothetical protein QOI37_1112 [Chloroflexota bacterium]|nr:hypothetical protein [Chloroflexota bacterium]